MENDVNPILPKGDIAISPRALLVSICIGQRPKWNSILPLGNIVILPKSCRPIQSFIALA